MAKQTEIKKVDRVRLLYVGSNANNGSICGLSASNANNAFSNSNANIGARLKFIYKNKHDNATLEDPATGKGESPKHAKNHCNPTPRERASRVTLKARSMKMKAFCQKILWT